MKLATVVVAALLLPSVVAAQDRERPVPLDTAGTVQEIDPDLRRSLDLFPAVEGFRSARLFQREDGSYVLEITFQAAEGPSRERRVLSEAEVSELRTRISAGLAQGVPGTFSTDGRAGLILTSTALGLGYYGWVVPAALDLDEPRGAVAAYLLTAGASFLLPYHLTRNRPVTRTQRNAAAWGATRGGVYGMLIGDAVTGGEEIDAGADPDDDEGTILATGMAASLLGGALGYAYGGRPGLNEGSVAFRATVADFALAWGFGTSLALGLYEAEVRVCTAATCFEDSSFRWRPAGELATMALGIAGTAAAARWPSAGSHTLGNTRALRSFGLLGAQTLLPISWAIFKDEENERGVAAGLVAGSVAGMALGDRLLRDRQLGSGSGLLVLAGHLAGGLGALGLTYLVTEDTSDREVLYMTTSALGSVAGSWLTLSAVDEEGPSGAPDPQAGGGSGPVVEVHALGPGLMALLAPPSAGRTDIPWVRVRW